MPVSNTPPPPSWHLDPVTYDVMEDPVMCDDGHTYDRATAQRMHTSPFTRKPLHILVDNVDVRGAIFESRPDLAAKYSSKRVRTPEMALRPPALRPRGTREVSGPLYPRDGFGCAYYPDNVYYEGSFRGGLPNGQGVWETSRSRYEGQIRSGRWHGRGTLQFDDGTLLVGTFQDHAIVRGDAYYPDGRRYSGEFKNGQRHGRGVLTFADGYKYEGEFREHKKHGIGVVTWQGQKQRCLFENGKRIHQELME